MNKRYLDVATKEGSVYLNRAICPWCGRRGYLRILFGQDHVWGDGRPHEVGYRCNYCKKRFSLWWRLTVPGTLDFRCSPRPPAEEVP